MLEVTCPGFLSSLEARPLQPVWSTFHHIILFFPYWLSTKGSIGGFTSAKDEHQPGCKPHTYPAGTVIWFLTLAALMCYKWLAFHPYLVFGLVPWGPEMTAPPLGRVRFPDKKGKGKNRRVVLAEAARLWSAFFSVPSVSPKYSSLGKAIWLNAIFCFLPSIHKNKSPLLISFS